MAKKKDPSELCAMALADLGAGRKQLAIRRLQRAAVLYALLEAEGQGEPARHAEACRLLAEVLRDEGRLPEALQALQEAADALAHVPGAEDQVDGFARDIVQGANLLRSDPQQRLYLLVAHLEREQRRLAEVPGSLRDRGDCAFRIGTLLHRRDRFAEAERRYREALRLYRHAEGTEMQQAECHRRLAGLYQYELADTKRAVHHYREAIRLFAEHEAPWEGHQVNRELCEELLAAIRPA
ncbi:MAG: tetratricopeptide repeat protein [Chthonomonadales bacterium]